MGSFKLRRFAESDRQRLGLLLAKAKEGAASEEEEDELVRLLKAARSVSDINARNLAELREDEPPKKTIAVAKRQPKTS